MVISKGRARCPQRAAHATSAWLVAELMFAVGLLAVAMIPLAFSFRHEQKLVRIHYQQVIAMEILDGEMEILRAGQWRAYVEGEHDYPVRAKAATNLPGFFKLKRTATNLLLQFIPTNGQKALRMDREVS